MRRYIPLVALASLAMALGCRQLPRVPGGADTPNVVVDLSLSNVTWESNGRVRFDVAISVENRNAQDVWVDISHLSLFPLRFLCIGSWYFLPIESDIPKYRYGPIGQEGGGQYRWVNYCDLGTPRNLVRIPAKGKITCVQQCDLGKHQFVDAYDVWVAGRIPSGRDRRRLSHDRFCTSKFHLVRPEHDADRYVSDDKFIWESRLTDIPARKWQAMAAADREQALKQACEATGTDYKAWTTWSDGQRWDHFVSLMDRWTDEIRARVDGATRQ